MPIITISRGSYSMGKAIAERVASRLGYECVSREVLLEASDLYDTPEIKLEKAIHDAPSLLERLGHGKRSYVAFIQSALTRYVRRDDVVYHGLAGHLLLKNVSHVIKVRIIAALDLRVEVLMRREGCTEREAAALIAEQDAQRRGWTQSLYGVDPQDPSMYALVLNLPSVGEDEAVDLICHLAGLERFQTTEASRRDMEDLAIACAVKAALIEKHPEISVGSRYGNVLVYCGGGDRNERQVRESADPLMGSIEGIRNLEVHAGVPAPESAV